MGKELVGLPQWVREWESVDLSSLLGCAMEPLCDLGQVLSLLCAAVFLSSWTVCPLQELFFCVCLGVPDRRAQSELGPLCANSQGLAFQVPITWVILN